MAWLEQDAAPFIALSLMSYNNWQFSFVKQDVSQYHIFVETRSRVASVTILCTTCIKWDHYGKVCLISKIAPWILVKFDVCIGGDPLFKAVRRILCISVNIHVICHHDFEGVKHNLQDPYTYLYRWAEVSDNVTFFTGQLWTPLFVKQLIVQNISFLDI